MGRIRPEGYSMAGRVHIVAGFTGKWEDVFEWNVIAYTDKRKANAHANRANKWAKENGIHTTCANDGPGRKGVRHDGAKNPHDKNMRVDDLSGINYFVSTVPLAE